MGVGLGEAAHALGFVGPAGATQRAGLHAG